MAFSSNSKDDRKQRYRFYEKFKISHRLDSFADYRKALRILGFFTCLFVVVPFVSQALAEEKGAENRPHQVALTFIGDSHMENGVFPRIIHQRLLKNGITIKSYKLYSFPGRGAEYALNALERGVECGSEGING